NFTRKAFYCQRDLSFTLAGPLVGEWQKCFDEFWQEQGGRKELRNGEIEELRNEAETRPPFLNSSISPFLNFNTSARLLHTAPCDHQLAQVLYRAVDRAQHHVYIENFTFGDSRLIYKLAQARRRGVDVRVVMTLTNGTKVVNGANRVLAN